MISTEPNHHKLNTFNVLTSIRTDSIDLHNVTTNIHFFKVDKHLRSHRYYLKATLYLKRQVTLKSKLYI